MCSRPCAVILLPVFLLSASFGLGAGQNQDQIFRVEAEVVTVPVVVIDKEGDRLYTGLGRENFRILEDGKPQEITNFQGEESALTVALLLEYSRVIEYIRGEVIRPAGVFVTQIMGRDDYAAIVSFDSRVRIESDFTQNRQQLFSAINRLIQSPPAFRESSLFDALQFVLAGGQLDEQEYKGLAEVEGRTGVILVATGLNTLSRINFDEAREIAANSGVPVYSVGIGELAFIRAEPYLSGLQRLTFIQAQNHLQTFSQESGGRFYGVRFSQAVDEVLDSIAKMLRHQYTLGYIPPRNGKDERREIEVRVDVDGDGREDNERLELQHRRFYYLPEN